jgi:hypothetical protein
VKIRNLLTFCAALFVIITTMSAQTTVTVPGPPATQVVLTWTNPAVCTSSTPCTFIPYRVNGTATISVGTTGATALSTTTNNASTANDTSVTPGSTYSYAVETVQGGINSVPSNTITLTIPSAPPPPVLNGASGTASITVKSGDLTAVATVTIKDTSPKKVVKGT